ncbi:MAG: hemin-degrading factor [Gammaproteobacteria bacterium]|nr:hemin-degrading factor [Gammaproteobacteria bacterium]
MNTQTSVSRDPARLRADWQALTEQQGKLRIRDAAGRLGVSEAELLATGCGAGVTRLEGDWKALLLRIETLGKVKTITRNDSAVHETTGLYTNVGFTDSGAMGISHGDGIDLRFYMQHWHMGFAEDVTKNGRRLRSLQFFDADGTAVHKIYLTADSDVEAYEALVEKYRAGNQSPAQMISATATHYEPVTDGEVDVEGLRQSWRELPDVHHFYGMLKKYRVDRAQAMRLVGDKLACPVGNDAFRALLESASESGKEIMIFVGSPGVAQIYTGPIKNLRRVGEWFNVLDPDFNLHLVDDDIAGAWIVRKGSGDALITSLEVYDSRDRLIAQMFGQRDVPKPEKQVWRDLVDTIEPLAA